VRALLQAGVSGEPPAPAGACRLQAPAGPPSAETTTVVPLTLPAGPRPLQRSLVTAVTRAAPHQHAVTARDLAARPPHHPPGPVDFGAGARRGTPAAGRPVTSLFLGDDVSVASPTDGSDVSRQASAVAQVVTADGSVVSSYHC